MTIILLSVAFLEGMFVKKKLKSNEKMVATQENGENNSEGEETNYNSLTWYSTVEIALDL